MALRRPGATRVAALAFGHLVLDFDQGALVIMVPALHETRGTSVGMAASLVAAWTFASAVLQPLLGRGFLNDLRPTPDVTARIVQPALVIATRTDGGVPFAPCSVAGRHHSARRTGREPGAQPLRLGEVETLRRRAVRRVEIRFDAPVPAEAFTGLPDVRDVRVDGDLPRCRLSGPADPLVKAAARFTTLSLQAEEPDLEELFLVYYGGGDGRAA